MEMTQAEINQKKMVKRTAASSVFFLASIGLIGCGGTSVSPTDGRTQFFPELADVLTKQVVVTDNQVISGKHFKCDGNPYQALIVTGDNVKIEDSLFTDCYAGIIVAGAANTTISGNRFENMGVAIREKDQPSGTVITHNEFEGIGVLNCVDTPEWNHTANDYWACDVFLSDRGKNGKFNNNIVDNRGYRTRFIEDFVNLFGAGGGFEVRNNLMIGSSETDASSGTGGCIIIDGAGSNYTFDRNECYNVAAYGIGSASGNNATFSNNTVYMNKAHALTISQHPRNSSPGGSYSFGSTKFNGPCGQDVQITGNKAFTHQVEVRPGQVIDLKQAKNMTESCPVVLDNNEFHDTDPKWEIPTNVFDSLDANYFSGRRGR